MVPRFAAPTGRVVAALACLLALLVDTSPSRAQHPPTPSSGQAASVPANIPLPEVPTRAAEMPGLLRALTDPLSHSTEIDAIRTRLPGFRQRLDQKIDDATAILQGQPTLDALQAEQQVWQHEQLVTTAWLGVLTRRATLLQDALNRLAEIRKTWRQTREGAVAAGAPGAMLLQIDNVLAAVEAAEAPLLAQRTAVLDLQSAVAPEVARTGSVLAQFTQAQQRAMGGLLTRDSAPIWDSAGWAQAPRAFAARMQSNVAGRWASAVAYVREPLEAMVWHVAMFALLAMVLLAARRTARHWAPSTEGEPTAMFVLERPYASSVALALFIISSPVLVQIPATVRRLLAVLGLGPVIRLTRTTADPRLAPEFYMIWGLFAADSFREAIAGVPAVEQGLLCTEMLVGIVLLTRSLRSGALRRLSTEHPDASRLAAFRVGAGIVLLAFVGALGACVLGYMRLARLLASAVLASGALALFLYAGLQVVTGLAAVALRVWPLRLPDMVKHHRPLLERRIHLVLLVGTIAGWLARTLDHVGLFESTWSLAVSLLGVTLGRGSIEISVGNIAEFLLTLWLAYVVSAFIRFVLQEDVFPRAHVTRGLSYAISSLLNYVIVAFGFLLALGALGLDLSKVTVLAGAFGVGIGFGLQSVVNNFVSGLILLFERPIHVGDAIEVSSIAGEVSRIGIRASVVRTGQGAEIIVPNAQLITERVTNWTLSDRTRRIDLKVGVDYGTPPERVVPVLEGVARAHPRIMKTPAPVAVFTGFGDSSIDFELRAWTRIEDSSQTKTELAAAVYAALPAAGMSLPFPQREVRLLYDGPAARSGDQTAR